MRNVLREIATHFFVPKCGVIRVPTARSFLIGVVTHDRRCAPQSWVKSRRVLSARCWRIAALARYSLCSVLRGGVVRWWRVSVLGKGCELIGNGKVNVYL